MLRSLVIERDPIVTAKCVASLAVLSNGRLLFIGGGWNAEEMENHGTDFRSRFALTAERVLAMKPIWTQEEAEFHGRFVSPVRVTRAQPGRLHQGVARRLDPI